MIIAKAIATVRVAISGIELDVFVPNDKLAFSFGRLRS